MTSTDLTVTTGSGVTTATAITTTVPNAPVSSRNVRDCLASSRYWAQVLPGYADDMQNLADRWAIVAGCLAAIGGLAILNDHHLWVQIAGAAVSFGSALAALVPRIKSYGEMAGRARQLTSAYARIEAHLEAIERDFSTIDHTLVQKVIEEFDAVKSSKDNNLRDLPARPGDQPPGGWGADAYLEMRQAARTARRRYARLRLPWWPKP